MAHKKGAGSSKNGRESHSKRHRVFENHILKDSVLKYLEVKE